MSPARVFRVLAANKARELCLGPAFTALLFVQQILLFVFQRDAILALERDGLMVAFHPAQYGLTAAFLLLALFLIVYAAANPSRERESGALETLFYGPVSAGIYLLAEMTAILAALALSLLFLLVGLALGRLALGCDLPPALFGLALFCLPVVFSTAGAALFIAAAVRQARAAAALVAALILVSLALFAADFLLSRGDLAGSFFLVYLRASLAGANAVFGFIFPLGLFLDDLVRFESYGAIPAIHLAYYPVYGAVFMLAAVRVLRRGGVSAR